MKPLFTLQENVCELTWMTRMGSVRDRNAAGSGVRWRKTGGMYSSNVEPPIKMGHWRLRGAVQSA
jgi:hypothetical protein